MAWHLIGNETTVAPVHALTWVTTSKGVRTTCIGKTPTGGTVEKTHAVWRCGNCRALAVCGEGERPSGDCGKCGARG